MIFGNLLGRRVLVVEDNYIQATELTLTLENQGSDVVGPFPNLEGGLMAVENAAIDAAVLDVRLGADRVFELADRLQNARVPFMFVTGYDKSEIPERFKDVSCLSKPVSRDAVAVALAVAVAQRAPRH
ncbi:response regulator [Rhizobium tubonense]|uniref:Response regulatory domain-containing protein n=1 Tax=Rhizobium tubonense TaxID=484088 RepID=A0A2W4CVJ3_9HYPH|nr:response regulator [Rhizobium tubonense]PZM14848.1 hypothetical protein CPY51_09100 [Rhizobium tubonense]